MGSESPAADATAVADPQGQVPSPFAYSFSEQPWLETEGGMYKIADSTVFNVTTLSVAEIKVVPGGMREMHVRVECFPYSSLN